MASPFTNLRSEHAIIISPRTPILLPLELREPASKRPRFADEPPLSHVSSQKRLNLLFFKTRLCQKFRSGFCPNGQRCSFAHGLEELRLAPPNWQEIVAKECTSVNEMQLVLKNKICKRFYRGEVCPYGERCTFLHVEPGMLGEGFNVMNKGISTVLAAAETGDGIGESIVVVGPGSGSSNQRQVFWKTRMCNKWEASGYCPFGEKCHFAHGHAEMKDPRSQITDINLVLPLKPDPQLTMNALQSPPDTLKPQIQQRKRFLRMDGLQKVSRIYADWIDDLVARSCISPPQAGGS